MADRESLVRRVIAWALSLRPVRAFLLYSEQKGALLAASVTYRALFSIFAATLLGFSAAAVWLAGRPELWQALVNTVDAVIPGLVGEEGVVQLDELEPIGFSVAGIFSLFFMIVAMIGVIGALRTSIRMMAGTAHDDVFIVWLILRDLLFAIIVGALLLVAVGVTMVGSAFFHTVTQWFGIGPGSGVAATLTRILSIVAVFALDSVVIAMLFRMLAGMKVSARVLWSGAAFGGVGLVVLQQLSGLFVGGATRNPLLTSFAALITLLLWFNLSAQVVLIASAYIITGAEDEQNRIGSRYGAETFAQRKVRQAEREVFLSTQALRLAREEERAEREGDERDRPENGNGHRGANGQGENGHGADTGASASPGGTAEESPETDPSRR